MNIQLIDSLITIIKSFPQEEQVIFYEELHPYQRKNNSENNPFKGNYLAVLNILISQKQGNVKL